MTSLVKNENIATKTSRNNLSGTCTQLNSNFEKLLNDNKNFNDHIKKLDDAIQKAFENKEILIKENANKRAIYNAHKKTIDLKRNFLSSLVNNNQKTENENFEILKIKIQELANKNPEIYGNALNLNKFKNQLLSKIFI